MEHADKGDLYDYPTENWLEFFRSGCQSNKVTISLWLIMGEDEIQPCRKCHAPNPISNEYCRECGALLSVSTVAIMAQSGPILPAVKKIRWQWVGLGALAILGLIAVFLGILTLIAWLFIGVTGGIGVRDLGALTDEFLGLSIAAVTLFLAAFGFGGVTVALLSKHRIIFEPVIAALVVLILLGVVGSAMTNDAPFVAAIFGLPSAVLAGLGSRIGALFSDGGKTR